MACVKDAKLTYEDVAQKLSYDPDNGIFRWKVDIAKNVKAGSIAGTYKGARTRIKTGKQNRYLYIKLDGYEFTGARIAWLLTHKEWPEFNIQFEDGDTSNLKISNLKEGKFRPIKVHKNGRRHYKMKPEVQRHYGLKRYYGIDLETYQKMLLEQNGVCAICGKPETSVVNGKIKPLAVDHCHDSTKIRGLLCARCNQAIGLMGEDVSVLSKAIAYLNTHQNSDTQ